MTLKCGECGGDVEPGDGSLRNGRLEQTYICRDCGATGTSIEQVESRERQKRLEGCLTSTYD